MVASYLCVSQTMIPPTNGGRGEQCSPAFVHLHGLYKFKPHRSPKWYAEGVVPYNSEFMVILSIGDLRSPLRKCFCRRYMCGNGRTMFAPTINNHRRRRYLHSSFLIPHSSLLTSKKGVDKRVKVCYSHINRFKCYDGNK